MTEDRTGFVSDGNFLDRDQYRSIYSKEFFDSLAPHLDFVSATARSRFEDAALGVAGIYELSKYSQMGKVARHKEDATLNKVAKKAEELRAAFSETTNVGLAFPRLAWGIMQRKPKALPGSSREFQVVLQLLSGQKGNEGYMNPGLFDEFARFVRDAAETAAKDKSAKHTATPNTPVEQWLRSLQRSWHEFTDLPFTPGRYHTDFGGYENKTLFVLEELMKPLDTGVIRQQIESALRKVASGRQPG